MTLKEIEAVRKDPDICALFPFPLLTIKERCHELVVNDLIAIPVEKTASFFKTGLDISVFDPAKNEIGLLVFTRELGEVQLSSLTESQFIAFLKEATIEDLNKPFRFVNNYLVLKLSFYEDYVNKYMSSSAIWGGFCHPDSKFVSLSHSQIVSEITVCELSFPTDIFLENSRRAIAQPFAFERFLKFYHLLELRFDFDVISKIKKLNIQTETDLIGQILNDYASSKKEIARLEDIVLNNCRSTQPILDCLNKASSFQQESIDLLFKFGSSKDGNPLKDNEVAFNALLLNGFEEKNLISNKVSYQKDYRKFILKLSCYWIYRLRSSIAHNKIGEYILSMNNEKYIVEFGEPLLKEILLQCFKK